MPAPLLEQFAVVEVPPAAAQVFGIAPGMITLKRAWPVSAEHLALEYVDAAGGIMAAQWHSSELELRRKLVATVGGDPGARAGILQEAPRPLLLQCGGADAKLTALRHVLRLPGATLLVHRPERRAVARVGADQDTRYAKCVPPKKLAAVLDTWRRASRAAGDALDVARLDRQDLNSGLCVWYPLCGEPLHDVLGRPGLPGHAANIGAALKQLHASDPEGLPVHTGEHEAAVLLRWHERLRPFDPQLAEQLGASLLGVCGAVAAGGDGARATVHRDLHDKQVFVGGEGRIGVLDLDNLAAGEPELDVANLLVHLELRSLQGLITADTAEEAGAAFRAGYGGVSRERLRLYADSARLRLACVYAFRPRWRTISEQMRGSIGRPVLGE